MFDNQKLFLYIFDMKSFRLLQGYTNITTFGINTVDIRAERRRLRTTWTPEIAQEIATYHGIDLESELTAVLSQEIAREIDREIMNSIAFPMARRVSTQTLANDIVPVQPLNGPNGILYHSGFRYGKYNEYQQIKDFKLLRG